MVLASGAFDGLHAGHVLYLEAAKALCTDDELLICAVAPDRYIQHVKQRAPHWSQSDRLLTVHGLAVVDAAIAQVAESVASLIVDYRPRLFVKGPDWKDRIPEDVFAACEATGTAIAFVETPGTHVSETQTSDEAALAQFEQIVQSQQPASRPWQPVTDYSFEARQTIEGQHPQLIKDVFAPTRVLDAGCGPGHLVTLLRALGVNAYGGDIATPVDTTVLGYLDITVRDWQPVSAKAYDLVICREVIEHLTIRQIRHAVVNLCKLTSRHVYVTTRFAKQPAHMLSVDTSDDLDPTHISMVNQSFLRALFVMEGFKRRADLEQRMDWQHKGRCLVYERC